MKDIEDSTYCGLLLILRKVKMTLTACRIMSF